MRGRSGPVADGGWWGAGAASLTFQARSGDTLGRTLFVAERDQHGTTALPCVEARIKPTQIQNTTSSKPHENQPLRSDTQSPSRFSSAPAAQVAARVHRPQPGQLSGGSFPSLAWAAGGLPASKARCRPGGHARQAGLMFAGFQPANGPPSAHGHLCSRGLIRLAGPPPPSLRAKPRRCTGASPVAARTVSHSWLVSRRKKTDNRKEAGEREKTVTMLSVEHGIACQMERDPGGSPDPAKGKQSQMPYGHSRTVRLTDDERRLANFWAQLNFGVAGDVGPFTCWTTKRGKAVFIRRAPPDKPPSEKQKQQRLRFRMAYQHWKAEPEEVKQKWRALVNFGGWCLSAHNMYMSLCMNPEPERLKYFSEQLGFEIQNPPWVPQ